MSREITSSVSAFDKLWLLAAGVTSVAGITCGLGAIQDNTIANDARRDVFEAAIAQSPDVDWLEGVAEKYENRLEGDLLRLGSVASLGMGLLYVRTKRDDETVEINPR